MRMCLYGRVYVYMHVFSFVCMYSARVYQYKVNEFTSILYNIFVCNEKGMYGRGSNVTRSSVSEYDNGDVEKEIVKESGGMRNGRM